MKYNNSDLEYLKKYIKENNLDDNYYNTCLKELEIGKPIQYIIGNVNFYGNIIKVNLRSRGPYINELAAKYGGGGHKYASGVRLESWEEADSLLEDLEELAKNYKE